MNGKDTFKKKLSAACLLTAICFGIAGFVVPPIGEVADSVLLLIAQFLTACGTFVGLDVYLSKFISKIDELKKSS